MIARLSRSFGLVLAVAALIGSATIGPAHSLNCFSIKKKVTSDKPMQIACNQDYRGRSAMATGGGVEVKDFFYDTRIIQSRPDPNNPRSWVCQVVNVEGRGPQDIEAFCYVQCCSRQ